MTPSRKTAPTTPEIQIADRTPRGAWRLASTRLLAERPGGVEAVDDEQGHEHADEEDRQVAAVGWPLGPTCRRGSTSGWWLAKISRISAKTTMPEDLGADADVVEDRQQPDPERVDERRRRSA